MKFIKIFSVLLVAGLLFTGCQNTINKENENKTVITMPIMDSSINVQVGTEPTNLDPAFAFKASELTYINHLFSGLTTLNEKGEAVPCIAESWEVETDKNGVETYTFKINKNAVWNDGTNIKASDFVFNFKRILDKNLNSPVAYQLFPIKNAVKVYNGEFKADELGVSVDKDENLVIVLEGKCPDFLQRLTLPAYLAIQEKNVSEAQTDWSLDITKLQVSGKYKVSDWKKGQNISFEKNDKYVLADEVINPSVNFIFKYSDEEVKEAFIQNKVLFTTELPLKYFDSIDNTSLNPNMVSPITATQILEFNMNSEITKDKSLRKALSVSIDRNSVVEQMKNGYIPATSLLQKSFLFNGESFAEDLVALTKNKDKAEELLSGKSYTVKFLTDDNTAHIRFAEIVSKMWEEIGVKTEIVSLPLNEYNKEREEGNFDVIMTTIFNDTAYVDNYFVNFLNNSENNFIGFKNKDYDKAIVKSYGMEYVDTFGDDDKDKAETKDDKKDDNGADKEAKTDITNKELFSFAHKLIVEEETAITPIFHLTINYAVNKNLTGYTINNLGAIDFSKAIYVPIQ